MKRWEGYLLSVVILSAMWVSSFALWAKLDLNQRATALLINTIYEQSQKDEQAANGKTLSGMEEILKHVQSGLDKTDSITTEILGIEKSQAEVLDDLKNVTTAHTKDIAETKHQAAAAHSQAAEATKAAKKGLLQSQKTQKEIAKPWYQRVFH